MPTHVYVLAQLVGKDSIDVLGAYTTLEAAIAQSQKPHGRWEQIATFAWGVWACENSQIHGTPLVLSSDSLTAPQNADTDE